MKLKCLQFSGVASSHVSNVCIRIELEFLFTYVDELKVVYFMWQVTQEGILEATADDGNWFYSLVGFALSPQMDRLY